jgi:hypothetical protein
LLSSLCCWVPAAPQYVLATCGGPPLSLCWRRRILKSFNFYSLGKRYLKTLKTLSVHTKIINYFSDLQKKYLGISLECSYKFILYSIAVSMFAAEVLNSAIASYLRTATSHIIFHKLVHVNNLKMSKYHSCKKKKL